MEIEVISVNDADSVVDIIQDFSNERSFPILSNVFQLRVEIIKNHINHLSNICDQTIVPLQDPNSSQSVDFHQNQYINECDTMTIKQLLIDTATLVTQLDHDRAYIEGEIEKQVAKVDELLAKISNIAIFRIEMLPNAVQKEHETCANDISELQWHIKHRGQIEKKLRQKKNKATEINGELLDEIGGLKETMPLMQEKLELETAMMVSIQETKEKLIEESEATAERMRVTQEKHDDANRKVDNERKHIEKDLDKANKTLAGVQKSLQHGEKEFVKLLNFKAKNEEKIRKNNEEIMKLISDNDSKKNELLGLEDAVDKLDRKDKEVQIENIRLMEEDKETQILLTNQELDQTDWRKKLNNTKEELDLKLVSLRRNNKQMEEEIMNIKASHETSVADTDKLRGRIKTAKEDIRSSKKQCMDVIEDFNKVSKEHGIVKQKYNNEMRRMQEIEEQFRHNIVELEKSIKQEMTTTSNFKLKIVSDSQDFETIKTSAFDKQRTMQKAVKEAVSATREAQIRVSEQESLHEKCSAELSQLETSYKDLISFNQSVREEKHGTMQSIEPIYQSLQKKLDDLNTTEERINWEIRNMNSELNDLAGSDGLMIKSKKKIQESLLTLEKDHNSVSLELETCRRQIASTEEIISRLASQSTRLHLTHDKYLQKRRDALAHFEAELKQALVENKQLATQYRTSQTDFFSMQDAFLDVIQEQLWGEESVKSVKEVQRLQKYMHTNMDLFFTLKLMYDRDQYRDLLQESGRSECQIKELKEQYSTYVNQIRRFLEKNFMKKCSSTDKTVD